MRDYHDLDRLIVVRRNRRPSPQTVSVLLALDERASEWTHGYELCRELDLKAGTVYPILMRLAERGLVESDWESETPKGRPPRHLYRLSPNAAAVVDEARRSPKSAGNAVASSTVRPDLGMAPG